MGAGGDARGFDVLFRATGASVVGYLRSRSVSDPDGLANEVFLRVFRSIHTFTGDGARFRSWLFTIAHNAAGIAISVASFLGGAVMWAIARGLRVFLLDLSVRTSSNLGRTCKRAPIF